MTKVYTPSPTIARLMHTYREKTVNLLLGPIGGGKTTGIIMLLMMIAHAQTPDANGVRKTRFGVARNTRPQLRDSVLKSVFDWLPPNGSTIVWMESDMTLKLKFKLSDDTWVQSEWLFRALDDERDAQRLLSVEYTVVWLSEFREIPFPLLTDVMSRTGRYPAASDGGCTWRGVLAESNMPTRGSDWHRYLELELPSIAQKFIQPSGIGPLAENLQFLAPDYYSVLMETATPGWIQAHILSEYPDSLDGRAVYAATFSSDRHVSKVELPVIGRGALAPPILMGVDQGRNPAALFGQVQPGGSRLNVLSELMGSNMSMETFGREHIVPHVAANYPGVPILAVMDPAGFFKGQANDQTPADVLMSMGFRVIPAPSNLIPRRLAAVDSLFIRHDGIIIDPRCRTLITGLAADYRFKVKKSGELEEIPEKRHPISDIQDCLQYMAQIAGGTNYGRVMNRLNRGSATAQSAAPPRGGWT